MLSGQRPRLSKIWQKLAKRREGGSTVKQVCISFPDNSKSLSRMCIYCTNIFHPIVEIFFVTIVEIFFVSAAQCQLCNLCQTNPS